jgi:hypothetical protein
MTAQVFSFLRRHAAPRDWSPQELGEFYRVESALIQAGLRVVSARGLTDEDEPWFIFCRAEDDEVIIHFARIDGRYLISAPAYCDNAVGYDFRAMVRGMIERSQILRPPPSGDNLFLHPTALLIVLVASAFLKAGYAAEAAPAHETGSGADAVVDAKSRTSLASGCLPGPVVVMPDPSQQTLILSAINAAILVSVSEHVIATAPSPAPPAPEAADQPQMPQVAALTLDKLHDSQVVGSSGMSSTASPQSVIVTPVDLATNAPTHTVPQNDTLAIRLNPPDSPHGLPPPDAPTLPAAMTSTGATPDPGANVPHVSLSGSPNIPNADKVLLLALGIPDSVGYTSTMTPALSTIMHTSVHTTAINDGAPASPAGPAVATPVTPTVDSSHLTQESVSVPVAAGSPGPAVASSAAGPNAAPDMVTVLTIVQLFQAVEVQPALLLNNHGAIFYDVAAINTQYSAVKSVTYDFGDGFSISLVGLPAELTHAGAHV